VMEHRWLAEDAARSLIEQTDVQRGQFYQGFFGVDWTDPLGYHVTVNTGRLRPQGVNLISLMAEQHWSRAGQA
jgi:cytidylate kinase